MGRGDAGGQERGKGIVRVLVHADPLAAAGTQHVQQPVGVLFLVDPVLLEQHLVNNAVLAGRCAGRGLGIGFKVERPVGDGRKAPGRHGAFERLKFAQLLGPAVGVLQGLPGGVEGPQGRRLLADSGRAAGLGLEAGHHVPAAVGTSPGIPLQG